MQVEWGHLLEVCFAKKGDVSGGMTCGRGWYGERTAGTTSGDAFGVTALPIKEFGGVSQAFAGN